MGLQFYLLAVIAIPLAFTQIPGHAVHGMAAQAVADIYRPWCQVVS